MNDDYIKSGRTNQKLETRNKILDSAKFFLNEGVDFNLEDVANKSGMSRATIYRYYSNVEVLAAEAVLDISTKSPQTIYNDLKGLALEDKIYQIQDYFNTLTFEHENAFRKYLSTVMVLDPSEVKRGARRPKALKLILDDTDLNPVDKINLANLFTLMMGLEPVVIAKDVLGLKNEDAKALLKWGLELLIKGVSVSKK